MAILIPLYAMMGDLSLTIKMEELYALSMIGSSVAFLFSTIFLVDYPSLLNDKEKISWIARVNGRELPKDLVIRYETQ